MSNQFMDHLRGVAIEIDPEIDEVILEHIKFDPAWAFLHLRSLEAENKKLREKLKGIEDE